MDNIEAIDGIEKRFRASLAESVQQVLPEVERIVKQKWKTAQILLKIEASC